MKKIVTALITASVMTIALNAQAAKTGEEVYKATCKNCHEAPVSATLKSPEFGNKEEWAASVAKGAEALYEVAINGSKTNPAMVARGTCADCSDDELKAAVDYMLDAVK